MWCRYYYLLLPLCHTPCLPFPPPRRCRYVKVPMLAMLFLQYYAKWLAGKNVSKMTYFVSSGTWSHNSINQWILHLYFWLSPCCAVKPVCSRIHRCINCLWCLFAAVWITVTSLRFMVTVFHIVFHLWLLSSRHTFAPCDMIRYEVLCVHWA